LKKIYYPIIELVSSSDAIAYSSQERTA
jgi:hypothetical protein